MSSNFRWLAGILAAALLAVGPARGASVPSPLVGSVTADRGVVVGFRVSARDIARRVTYTVFTREGRFRFPPLPDGAYDVSVGEERNFSSPVLRVAFRSGRTKRIDLRIVARPGLNVSEQFRPRDPHVSGIPSDKLPLVPYASLYPPGPGRDVLESRCAGCHGTLFHHLAKDRAGWSASLDRKTKLVADHVPLFGAMAPETVKLLVDYLATNFGPNRPMQDLMLDELRIDETAVSSALFVEFELPVAPGAKRQIHDPFVSAEGSVWFTDTGAGSVFELDPDSADFEHRIRQEHRSPNPGAFMHGLTVDGRRHVYYADLTGGRIGELDTQTGNWAMHETLRNGSVIQVTQGDRSNIYFDLVYGDIIGRLNSDTGAVTMWRVPTPDAGLYGLVVDPKGHVWAASAQGRRLTELDPATGRFAEYPLAGSPRRLCVDHRGDIWFPESAGGHLGKLETASGKIVRFPFPLTQTIGYDCLEAGDDIWLTEAMYQSIVRFRPADPSFTYFPMPRSQPNIAPGVPKFEIDSRGRMWYGYRGLPTNLVGYFDPAGNIAAER